MSHDEWESRSVPINLSHVLTKGEDHDRAGFKQ